jgi:uncharacterized protein (UPF0332 family)
VNEEILALLAKAKSKLKTARIDFENGQFEDSISRSYYSAFNAISALLLTKNLNFSSHETAENVSESLVCEPHVTETSL